MAWTYTDDPVVDGSAAQKRDAVRFLAQENQTTNQRVSDAEIAFLIATEANVFTAAARCAELVANRMGPVGSKSVGDLSITYTRRDYLDLAKALRMRGSAHQLPIVGGISKADKIVLDENDDWVPPKFRRDMQVNLDTTGTTGDVDDLDD